MQWSRAGQPVGQPGREAVRGQQLDHLRVVVDDDRAPPVRPPPAQLGARGDPGRAEGRMISGSVGRPWSASQVLVARRVRSGRPVSQSTSWSAASSLTSATPSGSGGSSVAAAKNRSHCRGLPSMKCNR